MGEWKVYVEFYIAEFLYVFPPFSFFNNVFEKNVPNEDVTQAVDNIGYFNVQMHAFFLKKNKKHVVEIFSTLKGTVFYIEMDILLFFAN